MLPVHAQLTQQLGKDVAVLSQYLGDFLWHVEMETFQLITAGRVLPNLSVSRAVTGIEPRARCGQDTTWMRVCGCAAPLSPCCSLAVRNKQWPPGRFSRAWAGNSLPLAPRMVGALSKRGDLAPGTHHPLIPPRFGFHSLSLSKDILFLFTNCKLGKPNASIKKNTFQIIL